MFMHQSASNRLGQLQETYKYNAVPKWYPQTYTNKQNKWTPKLVGRQFKHITPRSEDS